MNNKLKYRGCIASIVFSADDMMLHGRLEGVSDCVLFDAKSVDEIVTEFHRAVDEYLAFFENVRKGGVR